MMSSKLFSQLFIGLFTSIGGNILYNEGVHAYEYLTTENQLAKDPSDDAIVIDLDLQEKIDRLKELTSQSKEDDPKKSFELAVIGLSDFFGDEDVEQASVLLMLALIKNEGCDANWEKYGKKSKIFLTSYLDEPYQLPDELPIVCESTAGSDTIN